MQAEAELAAAKESQGPDSEDRRTGGSGACDSRACGDGGERTAKQLRIEGLAAVERAAAELEGGGGERTTPRWQIEGPAKEAPAAAI